VIIVVISIAAVGLLGVFTKSVRHSADPMLRMQAIAIAQGYLEEAMLKAFSDPEGDVGCEAGRALYDDVLDYACVVNQSPPEDQLGNPLGMALNDYTVNMTVNPNALLGMHEIIVDVAHNGQNLITLTGYRADY
jgi:MSHA pilin protein MshD